MTELSKKPVRDYAEHNAYFPSEYSLSVYTSPVTPFDGYKFNKAYSGGELKILMIGSDERYVQVQNGKLFSTGNHPVETLLTWPFIWVLDIKPRSSFLHSKCSTERANS